MSMLKFVILENPHFKNNDDTYNLKIRVSHAGQVRYISTVENITPGQIDKATGMVQFHPRQNSIVSWQFRTLAEYMDQIKNLKDALNEMKCQDLVEYLKLEKQNDSISFYKYAEKIVKEIRSRGKNGYADLFDTTLRSMKEFDKNPVLTFAHINYSWLKKYELWLVMRGCKPNGISIYMRNIRTIYNRSIKELGVSRDSYPFFTYKVPRAKTMKRNLSLEEMRKLWAFVPKTKQQEQAKDLFFLSFFLIGMNFKDLLYGSKKGIRHGRWVYNRFKTDKPYSIFLFPEALAILDKYKGDKLLLNILELKPKEQDSRTTAVHKDIISQTNKYISEIFNDGKEDDEEKPKISTYWGRHTWATLAAKLKVSKDIIAEALGHSETTTDIYTEYDLEEIDKANRKVISSVVDLKIKMPKK
jgi:site-specific recombinase XerD